CYPAEDTLTFTPMIVTKQLLITGRVQGVGFRFYMQRKARELGLTGWVRNCRNGSVEAVIQGAPEALETMIAWARRGPPSAVVAAVRVTDASGDFVSFEARPTE
ncbi:MAG: acylphosphatase, partial [Burkholderiales bacterium]